MSLELALQEVYVEATEPIRSYNCLRSWSRQEDLNHPPVG